MLVLASLSRTITIKIMTTKDFLKALFTGLLFGGMIYIFLMIFIYFIENEVTFEEILNPRMQIDYDYTPDGVLLHHFHHHHHLQPRSREELMIEASEHPERFTDEELVNLLLD